VSEDPRLRINKDTKHCMSLASRPGNFGTRLHNFLYAAMDLNYLYKAHKDKDAEITIPGMTDTLLGLRLWTYSWPPPASPILEGRIAHL